MITLEDLGITHQPAPRFRYVVKYNYAPEYSAILGSGRTELEAKEEAVQRAKDILSAVDMLDADT